MMNVSIKETDNLHIITDAKVSLSNGKYKIKWSYTNSEGFFIIAYPYHLENFNAVEYICNVLKQKDSEKAIKDKTNDILLLSLSRTNVTSSGIELGSKNDFRMPMVVRVYSYENVDENLWIYNQEDNENISIMQYSIKYEKKYIPGFLGLRKPKEIIKINSFESFFSGLLYYTVAGNKIKYPINDNMIGSEFEIQVTNECLIDIKVADEFKNYFRCSSN